MTTVLYTLSRYYRVGVGTSESGPNTPRISWPGGSNNKTSYCRRHSQTADRAGH